MAMVANDRGFSALAEVLSERGLDGLGHAVEILINGFKPKQLNTRLGALN